MEQNLFPSSNTKPIWNDEIHKQDLSSQFKDVFFPPKYRSLLGVNTIMELSSDEVLPVLMKTPEVLEWGRLSEVIYNPVLFNGEITFNDPQMLGFDNSAFTTVLSSLANTPRLIYDLFQDKEVNPRGEYKINLFLNGKWQTVIVDDYVPVDPNTKLPYANKLVKNELWVHLIAKAWAKVKGSYVDSILSSVEEIFEALTGFEAYTISLENSKEDEIFNRLAQELSYKSVIIAREISRKKKKTPIRKLLNYSIQDVFQTLDQDKKIRRLISLRTPVGLKASDLLPGIEMKKANLISENLNADSFGVFTIDFSEFLYLFSSVSIGFIPFEANIRKISLNDIQTLCDPQVFTLNVVQDMKVSIRLLSENRLLKREFSSGKYPMHMMLIKDNGLTGIEPISIINNESEKEDKLVLSSELSSGKYLIWLFVDYPDMAYPKKEDFTLEVMGIKNFTLTHIGSDDEFNLAKFALLTKFESLESKADGDKSGKDKSGFFKDKLKSDNDESLLDEDESKIIKKVKNIGGSNYNLVIFINTSNENLKISFKNVTFAARPLERDYFAVSSVILKPGQKYVLAELQKSKQVNALLEAKISMECADKLGATENTYEEKLFHLRFSSDLPRKFEYEQKVPTQSAALYVPKQKESGSKPNFLKQLKLKAPGLVGLFENNSDSFNSNGFYILENLNGAAYFGQCIGNGLPDGFGVELNGLIMRIGMFKLGLPHGKMIDRVGQEIVMNGEMFAGKLQGEAFVKVNEEFNYTGFFYQGQMNGPGVLANTRTKKNWKAMFAMGRVTSQVNYSINGVFQRKLEASELESILEKLKPK